MKSLPSFIATGLAVILFVVAGRDATDSGLRALGAAGGAAVAIVWLAWRRRVHSKRRAPEGVVANPLVAPRFFLERRRAPRHDVQLPVRLAVNGNRYDATLLSVSARGALLRLKTTPGEALLAEVGQPVRIEDYPVGTLARIGTSGVYVDFAVQFDRTPIENAPELEPRGVLVRSR